MSCTLPLRARSYALAVSAFPLPWRRGVPHRPPPAAGDAPRQVRGIVILGVDTCERCDGDELMSIQC